MPTDMSWTEMVAFAPNLVGRRVVSRSVLSRNCFDGQVESVEVTTVCLILTLVSVSIFRGWPFEEDGSSLESTDIVKLWLDGNRFRVCLPMTLRFFENGSLHAIEKTGDDQTIVSFFPPVAS
jgi:hypothetical protein